MRNFGQHNALMCGFHHARGRLVVTMDDDLQHPPESVATLLAALRDRDLDLVYGTYEEKMHHPGRVVGSWLGLTVMVPHSGSGAGRRSFETHISLYGNLVSKNH